MVAQARIVKMPDVAVHLSKKKKEKNFQDCVKILSNERLN